MTDKEFVEISGAGPAGLAAALAVVRAGGRARVYEKRRDVGLRFHGDFQGLENWTTEQDVLEELRSIGIETNFSYTPFHEFTCFDPRGVRRIFRSGPPLFYLLQRGAHAGSLDSGLKKQALEAGVEIRFNEPVSHFPNGGVVTQGPHRADAIAAGYLFKTQMKDGAWAVVSDDYAPQGYGYVLVSNGVGTLASCLFADFHNERLYVDRCVKFFKDNIDLQMTDPRRFGGTGNYSFQKIVHKGKILYAGESAGFQDSLFGFGMRWAMISGAQAGLAALFDDPQGYENQISSRLRRYQRASDVNRWIFDRLGNRGYRAALKRIKKDADVRSWMRRAYAPAWWKSILWHLLAHRKKKPLLRIHANCDCTWCHCERHLATRG